MARARFVAALYRAVLSAAEGGSADTHLEVAEAALTEGRAVVQRRHTSLHDPVPERLLAPHLNATLYHYGYLYEADTLCYWERERTEVRNLLLGEQNDVPPCFQF